MAFSSDESELYRASLELHRRCRGKLACASKVPLSSLEDLSLVYTPGVAEPCRAIKERPSEVYQLTGKANTVAVITDGSAVLGLGDIGPEASLPVMEGKCLLFKQFAGIDAFPLALKTRDTDELVRTISLLTAGFGGLNLEDISAPRCFEIETRLQDICDIPVFHDDQHGTAVIILAGLLNALKVAGKTLQTARIVITGPGAAGTAAALFLQRAGARDLIVCDQAGALYPGRPEKITPAQEALAQATNPRRRRGPQAAMFKGADVFIGLSGPGTVSAEMIAMMAPGAIVMAMANPTPEIYPQEALKAGALVVATGRSDFPNQLNNCLGFPGIFRGALDARAPRITHGMKLAAARALADLVPDSELKADYIIPSIFNPKVVPAVARAVAEAAGLESTGLESSFNYKGNAVI